MSARTRPIERPIFAAVEEVTIHNSAHLILRRAGL
jgi:hypothetical protein